MTYHSLNSTQHLFACLLALAAPACSGSEFSVREGTAGSAGSAGAVGPSSGGAAGTTSGGASGTAGAAGAVTGDGGSAGGGGDGGGAGTNVAGSGSGGASAKPKCGPPGTETPKLYTTLDSAPAILKPSAGTGPGAANGSFTPGVCGQALLVEVPGHYISYPALANLSTKKGTLDLWMLPSHEPQDGNPHQLLFVPGKFSIAKDDVGRFVVGVTDAGGQPQATLIPATSVPYKAGSWVRVTVTWDFTSVGQNVHVYFDGVEATAYAQASAGSHTMVAIGAEPVVIGARSDSGPEPIAAVLDDVKLFDTVLSVE